MSTQVASEPTEGMPPTENTSLWRHANFMRLWVGQSLSLVGSQITLVAIPLVAVTLLSATPAQMGILTALGRVPFIFILFVGVWVDRMRRRPLLIITDLGRGIILASIPILYFAGSLRLEYLYLVVIGVGIMQVFFDVADLAYLPSLVDRKFLPEANSKMQLSNSTAEVAGPGLAALMLGWMSAAAVIIVDTVSYFVSAVACMLIRHDEVPPAKTEDRPKMFASIKEGVRFVWGQPLLRPILLATSALMFFWPGIQAIYYPFAIRELGVPVSVIALIFTVGGPAAITGAALGARLVRRWGLGRMLVVSGLFGNTSFLLIPLAHDPVWLAVIALAGAQLMFGIGMPLGVISTMTIRQSVTPDAIQGRVAATFRAFGLGISPLGALAGGLLAGPLGLRLTILIFAIGALIPIALVFLSPLHKLHDVPEDTEDDTVGVA